MEQRLDVYCGIMKKSDKHVVEKKHYGNQKNKKKEEPIFIPPKVTFKTVGLYGRVITMVS